MANVERRIVLDTETTGLEVSQGHRIIEIGCVELVGRKLTGNNYHVYLNPEREVDQGALEVHGLTDEFLSNKPLFVDQVDDLIDYLRGAELVIHNAPFDVGFLDRELQIVDRGTISEIATVHDTLLQARRLFPGQRNDLDSLCRRYEVNNTHRELHGALLDAEILADVYLAMTGGQTSLSLEAESDGTSKTGAFEQQDLSKYELIVLQPTSQELENHVDWIARLDERVDGISVFSKLENDKPI